MFGFSFEKSSKKEEAGSKPSSSPSTSTSSQKDNEPSSPSPSKSTSSDFEFIVIKQVDSRPLYNSRSPSHLSPHTHHHQQQQQHQQHSHSHSHSASHSHSHSHSPRSSIDWNDAVLHDSALAFGSQKRPSKSIRSAKSTTSSSYNSRSPSPAPSSASTRTNLTSPRSRYPSVSTAASTSSSSSASISTSASTSTSSPAQSSASSFLESDDQATWEAWEAFRAKYRKPSCEDEDYSEEEDKRWRGGRYGPGRGYVEYMHLRSCNGDCEGRCLGK